MMRVDKTQIALAQYPRTLNKHTVRTVHQNFRHRRVAQQHFKRTEPRQFVDDFFAQTFHLVTRNRQVQARHILGHPVSDELRQNLPRIL